MNSRRKSSWIHTPIQFLNNHKFMHQILKKLLDRFQFRYHFACNVNVLDKLLCKTNMIQKMNATLALYLIPSKNVQFVFTLCVKWGNNNTVNRIKEVIWKSQLMQRDTSPHIYLLMGISFNVSCEICDLSPETKDDKENDRERAQRFNRTWYGPSRVDQIKLCCYIKTFPIFSSKQIDTVS